MFQYATSATALSVGGLRQQFSLPENIEMSLFGFEFIRTLKKRFGPNADVSFTPHGYLVLATEGGAEQLIENSKLQNEMGARNVVLQKHQLKDRYVVVNLNIFFCLYKYYYIFKEYPKFIIWYFSFSFV